MNVTFHVQYVRKDGKIQSYEPSQYEGHVWFKEYHLRVELGGEVLRSAHRESCMNPWIKDADFTEAVKRQLGRYIADAIVDQIQEKS